MKFFLFEPPHHKNTHVKLYTQSFCSHGFRGCAGRTTLSQGFYPLHTQRVPPFVLFRDIYFWLTNPRNCLKAPIYTNFEGGGARTEKAHFFVKIFLQRQKFDQNRVFLMLWESSEKHLVEKKKVDKIFLG